MKHLVITEGASLSIKDQQTNSLSQLEAEELLRYFDANNLEKSFICWEPHSVSFYNYVGFIQLGSFSLEILPKIAIQSEERSRQVLLNMLLKSNYFDVLFSDLSSLKTYQESLIEIFGYLYASLLKNELIRGVYMCYSYEEGELSFLKGRLIMNQQIRNYINKKSKVYCGYDSFSKDNDLNRIFKFTNNLLLRYIKNQKTVENLKYCSAHLLEVAEDYSCIYKLDNILFNRTNNRFYPAFVLAKMFLQNYSVLTSHGITGSFSFLFRMDELFEKYIAALALKSFKQQVKIQHNKYKLLINENSGNGVFSLRPDIVLLNDNEEEVLIIDTKWKRVKDDYFRHGVQRDDFYQMYAYLTRYKSVKSVILLYPYNECLARGSGVRLESWCLDDNPEKKLQVYSINYENESQTLNELRKIAGENHFEF